MRIASGAGDFEMIVTEIEPRGDNLVLKSKMGVWVAEAELEPRELMHLLWLQMRLKVIWYLLRVPFLALRKPRAPAPTA
jgi:hypothetical protein